MPVRHSPAPPPTPKSSAGSDPSTLARPNPSASAASGPPAGNPGSHAPLQTSSGTLVDNSGTGGVAHPRTARSSSRSSASEVVVDPHVVSLSEESDEFEDVDVGDEDDYVPPSLKGRKGQKSAALPGVKPHTRATAAKKGHSLNKKTNLFGTPPTTITIPSVASALSATPLTTAAPASAFALNQTIPATAVRTVPSSTSAASISFATPNTAVDLHVQKHLPITSTVMRRAAPSSTVTTTATSAAAGSRPTPTIPQPSQLQLLSHSPSGTQAPVGPRPIMDTPTPARSPQPGPP